MGSFRLTQLAITDLRSIGLYTQTTWERKQRNRYLTKLDQVFHLLAQEPQRGRACDDIRAEFREPFDFPAEQSTDNSYRLCDNYSYYDPILINRGNNGREL